MITQVLTFSTISFQYEKRLCRDRLRYAFQGEKVDNSVFTFGDIRC